MLLFWSCGRFIFRTQGLASGRRLLWMGLQRFCLWPSSTVSLCQSCEQIVTCHQRTVTLLSFRGKWTVTLWNEESTNYCQSCSYQTFCASLMEKKDCSVSSMWLLWGIRQPKEGNIQCLLEKWPLADLWEYKRPHQEGSAEVGKLSVHQLLELGQIKTFAFPFCSSGIISLYFL